MRDESAHLHQKTERELSQVVLPLVDGKNETKESFCKLTHQLHNRKEGAAFPNPHTEINLLEHTTIFAVFVVFCTFKNSADLHPNYFPYIFQFLSNKKKNEKLVKLWQKQLPGVGTP